MERIITDRSTLRKFGITMAIALAVIGTIFLIRHKAVYAWIYSAALFFLLFGKFAPNLLKYLYIFWMNLALVLAWVNTRVILAAMYYLVFTPVGLLIRALNKDLLDRKIEKSRDSYWNKKEGNAFKRSDYEHQF